MAALRFWIALALWVALLAHPRVFLAHAKGEPMLTGPTLFVAFPNSLPSFEVKPSITSAFYFDFTLKSFSEFTSEEKRIAQCPLPVDFAISSGSSREANETILLSEVAFTGTLCNNASVEFHYWVIYYAGNETEITAPILNITLTLKPFLPVLIAKFNVIEWPFAADTNSMVIEANVKVNVGPLEVGTGAVDSYQIISVPYYSGLYLNAFIDSRGILDNARNFTAVSRSFQIVDTDKPIQANVFISIPHFAHNCTYSAYATLTDEPEGITATSILMVVGIILGVFVVAGITIALIIRFTGNTPSIPEGEEISPESEKTPLLHSSEYTVNNA